MRSILALILALFVTSQAQAATEIDISSISELAPATADTDVSLIVADKRDNSWKTITFNDSPAYFLNAAGGFSMPDGISVEGTIEAGDLVMYDGTDYVGYTLDIGTIVIPEYTAGDNINVTSGVISVTGLNLADLSDAGAAAYLGASNGISGHVAVWVDVCSDTSIPVANCVDSGGTLEAALPVSVGNAEIADPGGYYAAQNLQGILQEIAQTQGAGLEITEQTADPTAGTMSTNDVVVATGTGDMFIKTATGLYTFAGTYAADATPCSSPSDANILNEGFEGTGYENAAYWSTSGSVNPDNTPSGTAPANSCQQNLLATATNANSYISKELSADLTYPATVEFYMYIDSLTMETDDVVSVLDSWNTSWSAAGKIQLVKTVDGQVIKATGAVDSAGISVSLDTWYKVELVLASTAASSSLTVGATTETFTRATNAIGIFYLGANGVSATESVLLEIDQFQISDGS